MEDNIWTEQSVPKLKCVFGYIYLSIYIYNMCRWFVNPIISIHLF